jgi:protocatechuate 3,4-dioxygenase beta subunit
MNSRLAIPILFLAIALGGFLFWSQLQDSGGRRRNLDPASGGAQEAQHDSVKVEQEQLGRPEGSAQSTSGKEPVRVAELGSPNSELDGARAAGVMVTGFVLDPMGKALAGAEVSGKSDQPNYFDFSGEGAYGEAVFSAEDGSFSLPDKGAGAFRLRVLAKGFAPFERGGLALPSDQSFKVEDIYMDWGVSLGGVVLDELGAPLAGIAVYSETLKPNPFGLTTRSQVATTGATGEFLVDRMGAGRWKLVAESALHPDAVLEGDTPKAQSHAGGLLIQMQPGFSISGQVLGIPAGSAESFVILARQTLSRNPWGKAQRRAPLAPDGSFELGGLGAEGKYGLSVYAKTESNMGYFGPSLTEESSAPARTSGLELRFLSGATVLCQVVDAESKEPITGLVVEAGFGWLQPLAAANRKTIKEFPGGLVRYSGLRQLTADEKLCDFQIRSVGYRQYSKKGIRLGVDEELDLGVIELERIPVARVTVLDKATAEPIEGATVSLRQESDHQNQGQNYVVAGAGQFRNVSAGERTMGKTNADGLAVMNSFEDKVCSLRVSAKGYAPTVLGNVHLPLRKDWNQTMELGLGGSVDVRVQNSDGVPAGGVTVQVRREQDNEHEQGWRTDRGSSQVTDSEGLAAFQNLEPGIQRFELSKARGRGMPFLEAMEEPAVEESNAGKVLVTEGGEHQVVLTKPESSALFGRLTEGGKLLVGASLRLVSAKEAEPSRFAGMDFGPEQQLSDSSGDYRLENSEPGPYDLVIQHPSRSMEARQRVELVPGENKADIDLSISVIEGRVVSESGDPIAGVRVGVQRASSDADGENSYAMIIGAPMGAGGAQEISAGALPTGTSDAAGRYQLRGVQPNVELTLLARGANVQSLRSEPFALDVNELRSTPDLVLKQAGSLRLELLREGDPVTFCNVQAIWIGEGADVKAVSKMLRDGKGVLEGLRPGAWRVMAQSLAFTPGSKSGKADLEVLVLGGEEGFHQIHLEVTE